MSREHRTHATCTVTRDQEGSINYIVVRAESFYEDTDKHENDTDRYQDGVNAKFKFSVSDSEATLVAVKDIEDGAQAGYETALEFIRAIPVAEDAVMNVPGVDIVDSTEGHVMRLFDNGRNINPE